MLACLPRGDSVVVYVDVAALRASRLLDQIAGSKAMEELEYKQFVEQSGFDYRRDIDQVAGAFARDDVYLVVTGRFDWPKLNSYAAAKGGECRTGFCRMPASQPGRTISFFPLRSGTMALAVSSDAWAATNITDRRSGLPAASTPDQPVWLSVPGVRLREWSSAPAGTRSFVRALGAAETLTFAIGPEGERLQLRADVLCATPQAAAEISARLTETTDLFKKMLERQKLEPNPRDLSGLLVGGAFKTEERRVIALWPMERAFITSLASGSAE